MATFQHPASLNALKKYGQACSILRTTSRAKNPAWYQEALELNFQLHIRTDGASLTTHFYDLQKNAWSSGPTLGEGSLTDPARIESFAADGVRFARTHGAPALGVILHVADEFATTELKPELNNPGALGELRETIIANPAAVLADSSIQADLASWRIIPYPASGSDVIGTALTISRQYAPFLEALRVAGENDNLPIITHALSAPLVGILGLGHVLKPSPGKSFVAIFQYPWFTTLAFFNEHADLRLIRTLQHRGLRRPTNFRNALATTNASLEFVDPDLFLVPSGNQVDTTLSAELQITFATSRVEIVQPPTAGEVPGWCAEPVIAVELLGTPAQSGEPLSHTFAMMRNERWALQNFLPTPPEILERFPVKGDMRLLKFLKLGRVALFLFVVLAVAYFGYGALQIVSSPEWAFDLSQAEMAKGRLAKLAIERKKAEHWNNLLDDRSKAWTALESLSRMFPENGGMLVDTYSHSAKPDTKPGTEKLGFSKDWKITGFARDEALEYLNNLNTREGMAAHFSEIARITGNPSYNPNTGSRSLLVNVRTQENGGYKPLPPEEVSHSDKATYPFTFDLTITQRFESTDPMALSVAKAP